MSIIFLAAGGARPRQNLIRVITGNQTEARANNRRDTASHPTLDNPETNKTRSTRSIDAKREPIYNVPNVKKGIKYDIM